MTSDPLASLRVTAALASWCGILALVTSHLLSPGVGFATGFAVALVALSCSMYQSVAARQLRKYIGFVILGAAALDVAYTVAASRSQVGVARTLPPLLISVLAAQGLGADRRHDLMVSVTVGEFLIVLAAGVSPTPWLALPLVLGWILAIVALLLSHQVHSADCSSPPLRSRVPVILPTLVPAAKATAVAMTVGLLLFLVLPHPSESAAQRRLQGRVHGATAPDRRGSGGRSVSHYTGGALDMRVRGDLGQIPVAVVPADSPQLWRASIYDIFDGITWTASEGPGATIEAGRVVLPPDPLDEGVVPSGLRRTDSVRILEGFDGSLIAPGTPVGLVSGGGSATGAARIELSGGQIGFEVASIQPQTNPATLALASGADPGDRWLQLPGSLPDRVSALAVDITGTAPSRPAKVQAITDYLAAHKTYDLNSPVPPPGSDAVDDFLFNSRTGFCEQFAAAEVVLLRTLDIPARMATGFGYGTGLDAGRRLFNSGNAHAWVEVFYPGIGWSPADPTPPSVQAKGKPKVSTAARFLAWAQRVMSTARGRLGLAGLIVAVGAAAFGVLWWRRRRGPAPFMAAPESLANPLLTAFARLEAALSVDGRARSPGETLSELERRLGTDSRGRSALATLELALYSPQSVSPEDARAAAHAFEQLASATLAAHAARGRLADSIGVRR